MTIKSLKNYKFRDEIGVYSMKGFALYVEGKGFITLDGNKPYVPVGGKKALQNIIDMGGFISEPRYILPIAN